MSLGVVVKGSEGVVLAADSRVSLQALAGGQLQFLVTFDNATKLLTFAEPHNYVGAVTYGDAVMGTNPTDLRTAQSFIPEFEVGLREGRIPVEEFAQRLSKFYLEQWNARMPTTKHPGAGMIFAITGFDTDAAYGSVYLVNIPHQPKPEARNPTGFGVTMGGQNESVGRLIQGYDPRILELAKKAGNLSNNQVESLRQSLAELNTPIPYAVLPLQDCIDLAIFLIRTTITLQNLSVGMRGVGGAIDVAVITRRKGLEIIQQKELVGEKSSYR